ncbi:MAG: glycosyltransferase family 87 protein [Halobacteriota archaeon]
MSSTEGRVRRSARVVLAISILAGINYIVSMALFSPEQFGLASSVYATAAEAWLAGGNPYEVSPPGLPGYHYLYPPIVLVVFIPHALLGPAGAYALQILSNLVVAGALTVVLSNALERRGVELTRLDHWLLVGFVLVSSYGMPVLIQGQTTLWLTLAMAVGFEAVDRHRDELAGAGFAIAALVKVFPAAVGLWLLRVRALRAVAVASLAGIGALAIGALLLGPELTEYYLTEVLLARYERESGVRVSDPTTTVGGIRRQLTGLFGLPGAYLTVVSIAILAPLLAISYRSIETDVDRHIAALATIVTVLLFMPLQPLYFTLLTYPLVIVLYRLERGIPRYFVIAGVLLTFVKVALEPLIAWAGYLPETMAEVVIDVATVALGIALPTDVGMWLVLLGCVLHQAIATQSSSGPSPASDDESPAVGSSIQL